MDFRVSLAVLGFAILLLVAGVALSRVNYYKRFKTHFSFRNTFPFEFNYEAHFVDNLLGNAFLVFSTLTIILFYASFKGCRDSGLPIFIFISGVLSSVFICMLYFVSTKLLKTHIVTLTLSYALVFMLQAATGLLNLEYYNHYHNIVNLIGVIYSFALAALTFITVMNPKLSFRIKTKEPPTEGDSVSFARPKWIVIAFSEWIAIAGLYLNAIGVIFFLISISF